MATAIRNRGSSDPGELGTYLETIRAYGPLAREEEHDLAVRARAGDARAAQKLVRHHLSLVVALARRMRRGSLRLEDLVQEGNLGLLRAVEKFDPDAGTRFATYAVWWVRAYVGKYLKEARSSVRPQSGTVAQADLSLDGAVEEGGDATHLDLIEDDAPGPEEELLAGEGRRALRGALGKVRRRIGELGWDIVHSRLERDEPKTLEEIGARWGVSRERVRQVELRTKQVLSRYLRDVEDVRDAA